MNKSTKIILSVASACLLAFLAWGIIYKSSTSTDFDINSIIPASEKSGNIPEHVEYYISKANQTVEDPEVVIIEYSDYQCSGCAAHASLVADLVEKYSGKVAVVHRSYILSYHTNGFAASAAAEAAGLQGYWKEYGDYLFENQEDWFYSDADTRLEQFKRYFEIVTDHKGDLAKFVSDMSSESVSKKVNFDISLAKKSSAVSNIEYTPAFFIDGEFIDFAYDNPDELSFVDYMSRIIDAKLSNSEPKSDANPAETSDSKSNTSSAKTSDSKSSE